MVNFLNTSVRAVFPFSSIVKVHSLFPDGTRITSTGVVVGDNDVLTAAHAVVNEFHGGAATEVKVEVMLARPLPLPAKAAPGAISPGSGTPTDPAIGVPHNPGTNNPDTNEAYDPGPGYRYDSVTGAIFDLATNTATGLVYDSTTNTIVYEGIPANSGTATENGTDSNSARITDPASGVTYDSSTFKVYDPLTGNATGATYYPAAGASTIVGNNAPAPGDTGYEQFQAYSAFASNYIDPVTGTNPFAGHDPVYVYNFLITAGVVIPADNSSTNSSSTNSSSTDSGSSTDNSNTAPPPPPPPLPLSPITDPVTGVIYNSVTAEVYVSVVVDGTATLNATGTYYDNVTDLIFDPATGQYANPVTNAITSHDGFDSSATFEGSYIDAATGGTVFRWSHRTATNTENPVAPPPPPPVRDPITDVVFDVTTNNAANRNTPQSPPPPPPPPGPDNHTLAGSYVDPATGNTVYLWDHDSAVTPPLAIAPPPPGNSLFPGYTYDPVTGVIFDIAAGAATELVYEPATNTITRQNPPADNGTATGSETPASPPPPPPPPPEPAPEPAPAPVPAPELAPAPESAPPPPPVPESAPPVTDTTSGDVTTPNDGTQILPPPPPPPPPATTDEKSTSSPGKSNSTVAVPQTYEAVRIVYPKQFALESENTIIVSDGGSGFAGSEVDIALLGFDVAFGAQTGIMDLGTGLVEGTVNISGYSRTINGNDVAAGQLVSDVGYGIADANPQENIIHFSGDVGPGGSGGPLWVSQKNAGNPMVYGVVSQEGVATSINAHATSIKEWIDSNNDLLISSVTKTLEYVYGTDNGDTLRGTAANEHVIGGSGIDTFVLDGARASYTMLKDNQGRSILTGPQGSDLIESVERLEFSDGTLVVDTANTYEGMIYRLYRAALGRAPDNGGLKFFANQINNQEGTLGELATLLLQSEEFAQRYGNIDNNSYINNLYQNVLTRDADQAGSEYWEQRLDQSNVTRQDLLMFFSESSEHKIYVAHHLSDGLFLA